MNKRDPIIPLPPPNKNESIVRCHFIVETEQPKATEGHNICTCGELTHILTLAAESPRKISLASKRTSHCN